MTCSWGGDQAWRGAGTGTGARPLGPEKLIACGVGRELHFRLVGEGGAHFSGGGGEEGGHALLSTGVGGSPLTLIFILLLTTSRDPFVKTDTGRRQLIQVIYERLPQVLWAPHPSLS